MFKLCTKTTKLNAVIVKFYTTVQKKAEGKPWKGYTCN